MTSSSKRAFAFPYALSVSSSGESSMGMNAYSVPSIGRTTGVGLRPRVPVQPTMHSRGTILLGTHLIEDEESRRLSEMAFLT